jgi:hypothetical protein
MVEDPNGRSRNVIKLNSDLEENFMLARLSTLLGISIVYLATSCSSEAEFGSSGAKSYDQVASRVFSFKSSKIIPKTMSLLDGGRYTSLDIRQAERAPSQVIQRQIRRQAFIDNFLQGHAARYSEEEFQLSEAGMLDFLVVVDNSRSMSDERDMVGRGLAPLISSFSDTNWQIAVVSMSNPCIDSTNLIKKTDVNASSKFADAVRKSVDWQATEQGFPMAIKALRGQCNSSTRPWLRDGSSVGVLFVSDEDNCGSDSGELDRCENIEGKNAAEMVRALRAIRPADQGRLYAIVDKDGSCRDAGGIGHMYLDALAQTGGTAGSICNDYSAVGGYGTYLRNVSTDVSRIIKRQFWLTASPDMGQFNVFVDGKAVAGGVISVNGKVVTIDPAAFKDGQKIKFGYTHDAIPMFSDVVLKASPALETLKVVMNGLTLALGADYQFDASSRRVAFRVMPPEDAKIQITYLENKILQTKFPVNLSGVRNGTLQVTVNNAVKNGDEFSYDETGVEFVVAPVDGAVVSISWRTEEHKIRDYSARLSDPRRPVSWQVMDKSSGSAVPAEWDGVNLKFASADVIEGRTVVFTVDYGEKSQTRSITLPSERIDDVVKVLADGREGVCWVAPPSSEGDQNGAGNVDKTLEEKDAKNWKSRYKGRDVYIKCEQGIDYAELKVDYLEEVERTGSFAVKLAADANPEDPLMGWKVYVDGVRTQDFRREGSVVVLDGASLAPETRVDVEVITYRMVGK